MELEDLARLRHLAYRLLSSTLLYPNEGRSTAIASAAAALYRQRNAMTEFAFYPQWQRLLASLIASRHHCDLEEEYVRVFLHSPERTPCLQYESAYMDPGQQAAGWGLTLLEREYAAVGLALSASIKDLPDHISVELEFMAFLCNQEADAWNKEAVLESVQVLERQAAFLQRHLTRWVPEWAKQVAAADGEGLYRVVAETAQAFVSHDLDLIGTLLDRFRSIQETAEGTLVSGVIPEKR